MAMARASISPTPAATSTPLPRIGVNGSFSREDSSASISPLLPNPSNNARADVFWRQPLARGVSNADYNEGRAIAEAGVESAAADRVATFDAIARRTADVYFSAAFVYTFWRARRDALLASPP